MINTPETYRLAGQNAAIARNRNDESLYRHWRNWWAQARGLESDKDREVADAEYDKGWKEARRVPRFEPFR